MELEALQATLQHLQERPRMHIFDERYTTFVAYIDGLESGDRMCRDFSDWLARRYLGCDSNKHWVGLINDRVYPEANGRRRTSAILTRLRAHPWSGRCSNAGASFSPNVGILQSDGDATPELPLGSSTDHPR